MNKVLYALPTTHCNLSCPHCDIKNAPEEYNRDLFIENLTNFEGRVILFGGEPTLYQDRMFDIVNEDSNRNNKIKSISTNLLILNDEIIEFYKKLGHIATSWNPARFTDQEYAKWIYHSELLVKTNVKATVMITITDDLLEIKPEDFMKMISTWNSDFITDIKLEHFVGDTTEEYYQQADLWLCELHRIWDSKIVNTIDEMVLSWYYNCNHVFTMRPNGIIKSGCPHAAHPTIPVECYTCERAASCRPCCLQKHCSFPKELARIINEEVTNDGC